MPDEIESSLISSERWMNACVELTNTIVLTAIEDKKRQRIAAGFCHLSIEHYTGLHVLMGTGVYSSGLALYRPQFEAYLRARWFNECATDDSLDSFVERGIRPPQWPELVKQLTAAGDDASSELKTLANLAYGDLCDFTHGGRYQIMLRASQPGVIASTHNPELIARIIEASALTSLLAVSYLADLGVDRTICGKCQKEFDEIYKAVD